MTEFLLAGQATSADPRVEKASHLCQVLLASLAEAEGLLRHARSELAHAEHGAERALARKGAVVPITWGQARLDFVASRANLDRLEGQLAELVAVLRSVLGAVARTEAEGSTSAPVICAPTCHEIGRAR